MLENYSIAKKLLDVAHAKHQAIASNISNVETPGYKRQDINVDFDAQLRKLAQNDDVQSIQNLDFQVITDLATPSVRADGNNVQLDKELLNMSQNSVQYEYLTNYVSNSLKQIETAIKGQVV